MKPEQFSLDRYFRDIVRFVSNEFGLEPSFVMSKTRETYPVHARWVVWYLICRHGIPYSVIGRLARKSYGSRWCHGTVINGFRRIEFIVGEQTNDPMDKQIRAVVNAWLENEKKSPVQIISDDPPEAKGHCIPDYRPFVVLDVRAREGRASEAGTSEAGNGASPSGSQCPGAKGDTTSQDVLDTEGGRRGGQAHIHASIANFDPITRTCMAGGSCRNPGADIKKTNW